MEFPISDASFHQLSFLPTTRVTSQQKKNFQENIAILRDSIVLMTAYSNARGLGGHTGGAYDMVPELLLIDAMRKGGYDMHPILFDDAGHRVAAHYALAAFDKGRKTLSPKDLLTYREYAGKLPGHPERGETEPGFSSGRLGHLWSYANGVALAAHRRVILFSSDGAQQEGNNAEAARFAVAQNLPVTVIIDDNDVTISGKPSEYMPGFDLEKTLSGYGLPVFICDGENFEQLYAELCKAISVNGPSILLCRRPMTPGILQTENKTEGHDAISLDVAIDYLKERNRLSSIRLLTAAKKESHFPVSTLPTKKNRDEFGKILCDLIDQIPENKRKEQVLVIDSDLAGSCGLHHVKKHHPTLFYTGGVMERNNFGVAAGFGSELGRQGIFGTFSAFLEMFLSEITMARLNNANVLIHLSHSGIDEISDNTTHFGLSNFFADNGLKDDALTRLYFPADYHQCRAILERIFSEKGLRLIFSTRSGVPAISNTAGDDFFSKENGYLFEPGKDEIIREGTAGYVLSYGDMLHRALIAVDRVKEEGIDVGLINKPTLNLIDEEMLPLLGEAPFLLVVESHNEKQGLGVRLGSWLLERGFSPRYAYMGTKKKGASGCTEQVHHQELDAESILKRIKELLR